MTYGYAYVGDYAAPFEVVSIKDDAIPSSATFEISLRDMPRHLSREARSSFCS